MRNAIYALAKLLILLLAGCPPAETPVGPAGSATATVSANAASPEQALGERDESRSVDRLVAVGLGFLVL